MRSQRFDPGIRSHRLISQRERIVDGKRGSRSGGKKNDEREVHTIENAAGDFIFIEPGVPHEVYNLSDTEPVVAVVARSDADEWDRIIPYPRKPVI